MEGEVKGKTFKMKGHTLPGINQRSETKNLADGRSKSSTFQFDAGVAAMMPNIMSNVDQARMMQRGNPQQNPGLAGPINKGIGKYKGEGSFALKK